ADAGATSTHVGVYPDCRGGNVSRVRYAARLPLGGGAAGPALRVRIVQSRTLSGRVSVGAWQRYLLRLGPPFLSVRSGRGRASARSFGGDRASRGPARRTHIGVSGPGLSARG